MNLSKESNLSITLTHIFEEVKKRVAQKNMPSQDYIRSEIRLVAEKLGFTLSSFEIEIIEFHLEQEQRKFGILQGYVEQENINDIIIKSYNDISIRHDLFPNLLMRTLLRKY